MVKKFFKKKSKRVTTKQRHSIEKKVKAHHKKLKKANKTSTTKPKKKDVHIPNDAPFKDSILKEAEERRRQREEEKEKMKQKRKKEREKLVAKKRSLATLVADAEKRTADFERKASFVSTEAKKLGQGKAVENSLKAYYREFKKVVEAADVVLQVLDARDPLGTRCPQVEQAVINSGASKKLVLVLNKIDLVPKDNVKSWLKHLRNEFPTIAFKSSTLSQRDNLGRSNVKISTANPNLVKSGQCLGADTLLKLLGNYCSQKDIRTSITVGVVGFPNTGKSSLINSLKRSKACNVGSTPGVTKVMQDVQLDKHVKLLDCPGVVMASGTSDSAVILRNCVKVEQLEDPIVPVEAILRRCNKQQIMMMYKLPEYSTTAEMLSFLATRTGKLKKGGIPDIIKAARGILQDWNTGRITYFTQPPEQHVLPAHLDAQVVSAMSKEFDIEALLSKEAEDLKGLKTEVPQAMAVDTCGLTDCAISEGTADGEAVADSTADGNRAEDDEGSEAYEDVDEMEEDEQETVVVLPSTKKPRKGVPAPPRIAEDVENLQLNRQRKKAFKKVKKERRRADNLSGHLSDGLNKAMGSVGSRDQDDAYDFSTVFK